VVTLEKEAKEKIRTLQVVNEGDTKEGKGETKKKWRHNRKRPRKEV